MTSENLIKEHTKIEFSSDTEKEFLNEVAPIIIDRHNIFLKDKIKFFWVDFGDSVYDIHFEFKTEQCSDETMDVYLIAKQDTLMSCCTIKGIDYSKVIGEDLVSRLIEIINNYKNGEMQDDL